MLRTFPNATDTDLHPSFKDPIFSPHLHISSSSGAASGGSLSRALYRSLENNKFSPLFSAPPPPPPPARKHGVSVYEKENKDGLISYLVSWQPGDKLLSEKTSKVNSEKLSGAFLAQKCECKDFYDSCR